MGCKGDGVFSVHLRNRQAKIDHESRISRSRQAEYFPRTGRFFFSILDYALGFVKDQVPAKKGSFWGNMYTEVERSEICFLGGGGKGEKGVCVM